MLGLSSLLVLAATWSGVVAHTVITYPGWRGNNLHSNGTYDNGDVIPGSLGANWNDTEQSYTYPYGMQWMYPCGGIPTTTNRTKWPVQGGALALQPGWFNGHQFAFFYVNLGLGKEPLNYSLPMVPVFQITGPSNKNYSGAFCLPRVSLPVNVTANVGDLATIQVIETAQHGAALYSCVDIEFADPKDVQPVDETNCRNTTDDQAIGFNLVFSTKSLDSSAASYPLSTLLSIFPAVVAALAMLW